MYSKMNPVIFDPDTKINMSLDEIIRLTRGDVNSRPRKNGVKKNKGKFPKNNDSDHSVPLLTSSEGVSIYVSKKSPLLAPDIKQSFIKAVNNRALNAELLNKSKRIIPAKYKLVKTDNGVERILVPVNNYICKPLRKLNSKNHSNRNKTFQEEVPPLLATPVLKFVSSPVAFKEKLSTEMKVDAAEDDDDDVVVLESIKKEPELIDIELNMPVSDLNNKSLNGVKTLNDRFTRLTGNFQF